METMKQRLDRGDVILVSAFGRILHHNLIQMVGIHGGFHAVWFDLEHMDFPTEKLEIGAMAARAYGMDSFVRLAPTDYAAITRVFEAGASGVMAAQVGSAEQAEQIVRWAKFYPRGNRGLNSVGYDARFANIPLAKFAETANRDTYVIIQIETLEGLANVDEIAAVEGVDMLFFGPADMSQSLGVIGDFFNPKCLDAMDKISAACKKHNKPWGVVPCNPEYATMCVEKGCKMLSVASDVRFVNAGIDAVKKAYSGVVKTQ